MLILFFKGNFITAYRLNHTGLNGNILTFELKYNNNISIGGKHIWKGPIQGIQAPKCHSFYQTLMA